LYSKAGPFRKAGVADGKTHKAAGGSGLTADWVVEDLLCSPELDAF